MIRCNFCKGRKTDDLFSTNPKTGNLLKTCNPCREKQKAYRKLDTTKAIVKKSNAKYNRSEKGKAFAKKRNAKPEYKAYKKRHAQLPQSKKSQKRARVALKKQPKEKNGGNVG